MAGLTEKEKEALALFKQRVLAEFPGKVDRLELFGSKARGDAREDSDIDVLVVLNVDNWSERHKINGIAFEVMLDTNAPISPKAITRQQFESMQRQRSMFWQVIQPEMIAL